MPYRLAAQRMWSGADDVNDANDSVTPLSVIADQRGGGAAFNGKLSLDVSEAAMQLTRAGLSWGSLGQAATITFAFRASETGMPSNVQGFTNFTALQIQATLLALQSWSDVAGLTFVRRDDGNGYSNNATILFGNYSSGAEGAAAFAYLPGASSAASVAGDVWVNSSLSYNATPNVWGYGHFTLVHEIGHALGLLHPAEYNAAPGVSITYGANATYAEDTNQYTVMSYFRETFSGASYGASRYAAAPLLDDIAAAQRLYGANMSARTGDTTYGFNSTADRIWFSASLSGPAPVFAVWDAGGTDTLDFSGYSGPQLLDLRQGAFSNFGTLIGNVSIAIGAVIENAVGGAGDDIINGNSADNRITPGGGNNSVDGGLGFDTLVFTGLRSSYTITFSGQDGFISGAEGTTRFRNVESIAFSDTAVAAPAVVGGVNLSGDITNDTIEGTGFVDVIYGAGGDDVIRGLGGNDQLNGGRGNDRLEGGAGNDVISIDQGNDIIDGGEGVDLLNGDGALGGLQINLQLGTISGGGMGVDTIAGFEHITGSRFDDVIIGDEGANLIRGFGGIDTLRGGGGDDELVASWAEAGGAPDVVKSAQQANDGIPNAISLDGAFDRLAREGVPQEGTPHATIVATTHGGLEYYSFTVGANTSVTFDIDGATFDSTIRVFNEAGVEVASNDDATYTGDGGSGTDSFLNFLFTAGGTYYVQIGRYADDPNSTAFATISPPRGESYTLHVMVPDHSVQPTYAQGSQLYGDAGDDILRSSVGSDILDGGNGFDTAVFAGVRSSYSISVSGGITTVSNADGTDTVTNVEQLQFTDVTTNAAGDVEGESIDGTSGPDIIDGTGGSDVIRGLDGDDTINGRAGNDEINGGAANDTLFGNSGSDILIGGDGDDFLVGGSSADVIDGGTGNDTVLLEGFSDNDRITLGDGRDVLSFGASTLPANSGAVLATDFATGENGDRLDFGAWLGSALQNYPGGSNPFSSGHLRLLQSGGDTLLQVDRDGGGNAFITLITLQNTTATQFTSANLGFTQGFSPASLAYAGFGVSPSAGGWTSQDAYPRSFADMNGDGLTDVAGFGAAGLYVALGNGVGGFGSQTLVLNSYGYDSTAGGWISNERFPRTFGDVNGDGHADVIGFGDERVQVALANGSGGFLAPVTGVMEFGQGIPGAGWATQQTTPRMTADVNGDGLDDLVGFRGDGVVVALATGGGAFADARLVSRSFGVDSSAGGWIDSNRFPRVMADVNGDGLADIIGFGDDGVLVSLATGGGSFGSAFRAISEFGSSTVGGGWTSNGVYPRMAADVNGDGRADLIGFGDERVYVALANADGTFAPSAGDLRYFARVETSGGFSTADRNPRGVGDINGDGYADLIGVGDQGLYVSLGGPGAFLGLAAASPAGLTAAFSETTEVGIIPCTMEHAVTAKDAYGQPLVQPGSLDDDFLDFKADTNSVGPQIQPGVFDDLGGSGSGGSDFGGGFDSNGGSDNFGLWGLDPDIQRALDDHNARLDHMRTTTHITDPWG